MKKIVLEYISIILGCFLLAAGTAFLIVPAKIGSGGVTGIAIGLNYIYPNLKIGTMTLLINAPLFLYGYKILGKKYTFKSILGVGITSVLIDILSPYASYVFNIMPMQDRLLISILAGALTGLSLAAIYMAGGSTGGADIVAKIIITRKQDFNFSTVQLILDVFVYLFLGIVIGPSTIVYALVMSYSRKKTIDTIQDGMASSKQCIIITDKEEAVSEAINSELGRGVTQINALGAYSKEERKVLYTVVHISEVSNVKNIVQAIDDKAFISISPVNSIYGNFRKKGVSI